MDDITTMFGWLSKLVEECVPLSGLLAVYIPLLYTVATIYSYSQNVSDVLIL